MPFNPSLFLPALASIFCLVGHASGQASSHDQENAFADDLHERADVIVNTPRRTVIDADGVRADLRAWMEWTQATHPDLSWSVDPDLLMAEVEELESQLRGWFGEYRTWDYLAELNPILNDAHMGIRLPEAIFQADVGAGRPVFTVPLEVRGREFIVTDAISDVSVFQPGDRIHRINRASPVLILEVLLPRMRGETRGLRERVLSLQFPAAIHAFNDEVFAYRVSVIRDGEIIGPFVIDPERDRAVSRTPAFTLAFQDETAIVTVDSFERGLETQFASFLADSFAQISARGTERLVIDLRNNGGGARQLSDRLMAYLTADRYTPMSAVTARIVPENQALVPGSELGQVISTPFAQWVEPPAELAHRFTGEVTIVIGPNTYSQAVVFAATAQDFCVARLAGQPTEGPANQTGQVTRFTLPNSGLVVQAPIYIFTRASGETGRAPLMPDVMLDGDNTAQMAALLGSEW